MHRVLWVLQILLGGYFVMTGVTHFIVPQGLPPIQQWMYDLSPTLHAVAGAAEILGGFGLILPGLTGIQTRLTPLAAASLVLVMVGAMLWHLPRGEYIQMGLNAVFGAVVGFVAYGRWKMRPLA